MKTTLFIYLSTQIHTVANSRKTELCQPDRKVEIAVISAVKDAVNEITSRTCSLNQLCRLCLDAVLIARSYLDIKRI